MAWAKTRPEALSERTGKPDTRGAYGLLAREVIGLLKHLQHAPGRTVIFVGILEKVTDEMNRTTWQPQMDGGKGRAGTARHRRPGADDEPVLAGSRRGPRCAPDLAARSRQGRRAPPCLPIRQSVRPAGQGPQRAGST
jgi:hypothetical protein